MDAKDYVVNEVLRDPRRFMVPIYQRRYQWSDTELAPFWHDVVAKADEALSGELRFQHYMGALILAPGGDGYNVGVTPRIQVVDGQQRLTTFQLFLAALREVAERRGVQDIVQGIRPYLFNQPMSGDDDPLTRFKLSPTPADRDLIHTIIERPADEVRTRYPEYYFQNGNPRQTGVPFAFAAYQRFMWWIDDYARYGLASAGDRDVGDEADGDQDLGLAARRLHALLQALLSHMKLVVISLGEGDDAQVIFETLNSKGKPLLAMDLVRNNIFHRAETQGEAAENLYRRLWGTFEEPFWEQVAPGARPARPRLDHFLSHVLTALTGQATSLRELYAEYRNFARPRGKQRFERVEDELVALTRFAPTYLTLEGADGEGTALHWLGRKLASWEVTTAYPVAFQVAEAGLSEDEARAIYRLLYSYVVRRAICGLTAKNLNGVFQRIGARFLRDGGPSLASLVDSFAEPVGPAVRFPSDDELRWAMCNNPLYKWFNKGERLQDVLWELEVASRGPFAEALARPSSLWIEHVMPQSWEAHWPLPVAEGAPEQPEAERRERLIHTLGNLTLTTDRLNISLGNGMFEEKRAKLDASLLALNKWFASRGEWNEAAIEERSAELAERAVTIWPHPLATGLAQRG
ncbi:DUF262 domain-containing protein [Sphingomonas lenta]|uniref:DUF262 domain-containing protein n=1 Tax=Sphingomonas lenta TaxID=1141887 RepID=A0A2A2SEC8_9SPHN|nr:DUF262 domain-containing protein [Sphingomonas lenta]PAX07573.1 hypothetical protein CKY28_07910 [Sphingomonas lenta]